MFDKFNSDFENQFKAQSLLAQFQVAAKPLGEAKPTTDKTALHKAHATTITASNAWRLMSNPENAALSAGARSYVEEMVRAGEGLIESGFSTAATAWGLEHEFAATVRLASLINEAVVHTGENQKRFYRGNFVSALPDGVVYFQNEDGNQAARVRAVVEVKCLDTDNHRAACQLKTQEQFKAAEPAKFAQIQVQMLCAECAAGYFVFYDPRHSAQPVHILLIVLDDDFIQAFLARVELARAYYQEVLTEDRAAAGFTVTDEQPVEIEFLPNVFLDIALVREYHDRPEELAKLIQQQVGVVIFDMTTSKGRDACRSYAMMIIKCIAPAIRASRSIEEDARLIIEAGLNFRKIFEAIIRQIAKKVRLPLIEWEKEDEYQKKWDKALKINAELDEANRLAAEQLAIEIIRSEVEAYDLDELYVLRKEKAARVAAEAARAAAQQQAERDEQLKKQAAEAERKRLADEAETKEREHQAALAKAEQDGLNAIAAAELATQQAIEKAGRDQLAAIEAERQRAETQQREREALAEQQRQAEQQRSENKVRQRNINATVVKKLVAIGLTDEQANAVVIAASKKELGALTINY